MGRLGITKPCRRAHNWRSNCLHGWCRHAGKTDWHGLKWQTFPMPIGLGATFNKKLVSQHNRTATPPLVAFCNALS